VNKIWKNFSAEYMLWSCSHKICSTRTHVKWSVQKDDV